MCVGFSAVILIALSGASTGSSWYGVSLKFGRLPLARREASYGHGLLDLMNATHARWRWHRNQDAVPVVSDEVRSHYLCLADMLQRLRSTLHL